MLDTKKLYDIFLTGTRIVLSLLLIQFLNVVLFLIGFGVIFLPLIFLIDTICIQDIIFKENFFDFRMYLRTFKKNFFKSLLILGVITLLLIGISANINLITYITINNLSIISYFLAMIAVMFLVVILLMLIIYAPLVNATDDLSTLKLLKVTLIIPFIKFKVTLLLLLMVIFSLVIVTNNALFFLLIGPNLLIICNLVIYRYYFKERR